MVSRKGSDELASSCAFVYHDSLAVAVPLTCRDVSGSAGGRAVAASCPHTQPRLTSGSCTTSACLQDGSGLPDPSATEATACAAGGAHSWTVGTCCTATCCDGDIRNYYATTLAAVGAPTAFAGWKPYDHRARSWYREAKATYQANSSSVTSWSNIYEFSTTQAIGISVMGAAVVGLDDATSIAGSAAAFTGVFAIDFELGGLSDKLISSVMQHAAAGG